VSLEQGTGSREQGKREQGIRIDFKVPEIKKILLK
jgi:hypothetical protein